MHIVQGDLIEMALQGHFDIIVHGCNCFHTMGTGIAKQIKDIFYSAYIADTKTTYGSRSKLGTYSFSDELIFINSEPRFVRVINAYTQFNYSRNQPEVDYDAIDQVFELISLDYKYKRIGIPKIGTGHAGGDWNIISDIITKHTTDMDITVVEYRG